MPARGQGLRDPPRAAVAAAADLLEPALQSAVRRVEAQRDDVDREVVPAHRQLCAGDERNAGFVGGRARLVEAGRLVMVGEREDVDPTGRRAAHHLRGREQAVGAGRVAVQVVAHQWVDEGGQARIIAAGALRLASGLALGRNGAAA